MSYSTGQLLEIASSSQKNARSALNEAKILAEQTAYPRATFLLSLAMEETVKFSQFAGAYLNQCREKSFINWKEFEKVVRSHELKVHYFVWAREFFVAKRLNVFPNLLSVASDLDENLKHLVTAREVCLYSGMHQGKIHHPETSVKQENFQSLHDYVAPVFEWLLGTSIEINRINDSSFFKTFQDTLGDFAKGETAIYFFAEAAIRDEEFWDGKGLNDKSEIAA